MNQLARESPVSNDGGMIDDFRLWGSRRCRRRGVRLTNVGSDTWVGHDFNYHNASLSEGDPPPLWSRAYAKRRTGCGTARISPLCCGKAKRGCASRVPTSPGTAAWRTGGVLVVGATPIFWPLMRHERGQGRTGARTPYPPLFGVAPTISDPCRKAEMETWSQVILVNLALAAVALRVWLDPWPAPGECALLDLVRATDPVMHALSAGVYIAATGLAFLVVSLVALSIWLI